MNPFPVPTTTGRLIGISLTLWTIALFCVEPLPAAETMLYGRILDVAGQPVPNAEVTLYNSANVRRPANYLSNRTDNSGQYQLTVTAGKYWAVAVQRKGSRRFGPLTMGDRHSGDALELEMGTATGRQLDFVVLDLRDAALQHNDAKTELIEIQGKITDNTGAAIPEAYIAADPSQIPNGFPAYISGWTDTTGSYTLYLPPGRYFLGAGTAFPPTADFVLNREVVLTNSMSGLDMILRSDSK